MRFANFLLRSLTLVGTLGCNDQIIVLARPCVISGAAIAGSTNGQSNPAGNTLYGTDVDAAVFDIFNEVSTNIWAPANVSFLGCCQPIPVIRDPDTSIGKPGEIVISAYQNSEMADAYANCRAAWDGNGFVNGRVVLIAKDLIADNGRRVQQIGITYPGAIDNKLCSSPRNLVVGDVSSKYVIVVEQSAFGYSLSHRTPNGTPRQTVLRTLGHELGHSLLLAHGDGIDNDGDAAATGASGSRTFDSVCDPTEQDTGMSLMSQSYVVNLTPLQIELAREAAILVPGSAGGPP